MKTVIPFLCLSYALLCQIPLWGQGCASVDGPYSGTTSGTIAGGVGWNNINRIQAADLSYTSSTAAFTLLGGSSSSKYLPLKNFGFAIPVSATICGIQVDVSRFGSGLISQFGSVSDKSVKIIQGGSIGGAEQSTGANWSGNYGTTSFGGSGNLWGLAWTAADINAANFGVAMSVQYDALLAVTLTANIDYVQMTVYYDNSILGIPMQKFTAASDETTDLLNWTLPSANDLAQFDV